MGRPRASNIIVPWTGPNRS